MIMGYGVARAVMSTTMVSKMENVTLYDQIHKFVSDWSILRHIFFQNDFKNFGNKQQNNAVGKLEH